MREILVLSLFERSVKKLFSHKKKSLAKSLKKFNRFVCTGEAPAGLGFKYTNPPPKIAVRFLKKDVA